VALFFFAGTADDRVVNVANFLVAFAILTVGSREALQVGDRFDIPNDQVGHVGSQQIGCPQVQYAEWARSA
jgi:hypothetical protein